MKLQRLFSGDEDFFSGFFSEVDEEDAAVAASGAMAVRESCCACCEDDCVELVAGGMRHRRFLSVQL